MARHLPTILQIIPSFVAGGAEQGCVDVAQALLRQGWRALVASSGGAMVPRLEKIGAQHITLPLASKNPVQMWRNVLALKQLIETENVSIIHARSRAPAWSAYLAAQLAHVPFVTTFHAAYKFKTPIKKAYNSVMAKGVRVVAISQFIAQHIQQNYAVPESRVRLIYRGLDPEYFNPDSVSFARVQALNSAWHISPEQVVVLCPGRLSPIKGQSLAIKAFAGAQKPANAVLVLLGPDQGRTAYAQQLQQLAQQLGVAENVRFVASCSDMPAAYLRAQLVLMPSQVPEGFGRVPIEAMAMQRPIIASALGAVAETIQHEQTGWALPAQSEALWQNHIAQAFAQDSARRVQMGQAGRALVQARFTLAEMQSRNIQLYQEVLSEQAAAKTDAG